MKIALVDLAKITEQAYRKAHYPEEQIPTIVKILSYAQWRGNVQSLLQIVGPGIPDYAAKGAVTVVKDTSLSCMLDGKNNIGLWVMEKSMEAVLQKASTHGFGISGSFNTAPPGTAAIGYYVRRIAEQGLIAFAFSGSSKKVAPFGGYQPLFGSNPIGVGLPCTEMPIVIDMATSVMPVFKVLEAQMQHKQLPEKAAYDKTGKPTRDPHVVLAEGGTLTSFGSNAKGYSLSMLIEVLTGPLVGGAFTTVGDTQHNWGNLIYAIDPDLLAGREAFMTQLAQLRASIKASPPLPDVQEVFLPGEIAENKALHAQQDGYIEIDDDLGKRLVNG